jgi:hypothetical protein
MTSNTKELEKSAEEEKKERFQQQCAIVISLIATLLLINNMGAQNASSQAAFENANAINTFAFYQAKNIRQNDLNLAATTLDGIAITAMPIANEDAKRQLRDQAQAFRTKALGYESEPESGEGKKELLQKARQAEAQRDLALRQGPYFDFASLALQLAIILFSVVLITNRKTLYASGIAAAVLGTLLSMNGFFLWVAIPGLG